MNRTEQMNALASSLTETIRTFGRRHDITVEYGCSIEEPKETLTEWQMTYFGIRYMSEYFLISENIPGKGLNLLYAVDISADSCLTAASELMDFASRKGL